MKVKVELDPNEIIDLYVNQKRTIISIAEEKHVGKLKIQNLLKEHGIEFRKRGELLIKHKPFIVDHHVKKYVPKEGKTFIAKCKVDGKVYNDYENGGGFLTSHIRNVLGIEVPPLAQRNVYYMETGNYWYEQYFDIIEVDKKPTKKCPYCDWETEDMENKSGMMLTHIQKEHGKTVEEVTKEFPELLNYFKKYKKKAERQERLLHAENYVTCPICGEKMEKVTFTHLQNKHGYKTYEEFRVQYPNFNIMSQNMIKQAADAFRLGNLTLPKNRFVSRYEKELQEYLDKHGIEHMANRQILNGQEIDILIPSMNLGIEFNGLFFHCEYNGKKGSSYHLNKTVVCHDHGYNLIQIFEDEYVKHKDIVYSKLNHLLGINNALPKIYARKCQIKEIQMHQAKVFLNTNHIQGFASATIYLGAFYGEELVGVMCLKYGNVKNPNWELTRFATSMKYLCVGLGSKMFTYFVRNYDPSIVVSFADRRWTPSSENNLYTKLGFELEKTLAPDYKYYNAKVDQYTRVHKMSFSKQILARKYGFPMEMTEREMANSLGYRRIWDCGLFKYVWRRKEE